MPIFLESYWDHQECKISKSERQPQSIFKKVKNYDIYKIEPISKANRWFSVFYQDFTDYINKSVID